MLQISCNVQKLGLNECNDELKETFEVIIPCILNYLQRFKYDKEKLSLLRHEITQTIEETKRRNIFQELFLYKSTDMHRHLFSFLTSEEAVNFTMMCKASALLLTHNGQAIIAKQHSWRKVYKKWSHCSRGLIDDGFYECLQIDTSRLKQESKVKIPTCFKYLYFKGILYEKAFPDEIYALQTRILGIRMSCYMGAYPDKVLDKIFLPIHSTLKSYVGPMNALLERYFTNLQHLYVTSIGPPGYITPQNFPRLKSVIFPFKVIGERARLNFLKDFDIVGRPQDIEKKQQLNRENKTDKKVVFAACLNDLSQVWFDCILNRTERLKYVPISTTEKQRKRKRHTQLAKATLKKSRNCEDIGE